MREIGFAFADSFSSRGRDSASLLRGDQLRERVSADAVAQIEASIQSPRYRDIALRWVVRGLDVRDAIKKAMIG